MKNSNLHSAHYQLYKSSIIFFLVFPKLPNHSCSKVSPENHLPGNFLVLKDAFVMKDFESGAVVVNGVRATLIPIGPSLGWPMKKSKGDKDSL